MPVSRRYWQDLAPGQVLWREPELIIRIRYYLIS
jgi:hypothetical protein